MRGKEILQPLQSARVQYFSYLNCELFSGGTENFYQLALNNRVSRENLHYLIIVWSHSQTNNAVEVSG